MSRLNYLQTPDPIWRPYAFDQVVATATLKNGTTVDVAIPGRCFSEYRSGPSLIHLAYAVGELNPNACSAGLKSCQYAGFQIGKA